MSESLALLVACVALLGASLARFRRLELLRRSVDQLTTWHDLLQKFLRSDDDQV